MTAGPGPRRAVPFLNRAGARHEMHRLLERCRAEGRPCLLFVHGPAGMGRVSLVSEFFHEHRSAFDGGWIEVEARQADGSLAPKGEMLGQALRGLGLADTDLPATDAARVDAFQRLAADRRFLLVIKDVVTADQVSGLLPVTAPEAALVVTTRTMLRDLLTQDFADVHLAKLPRDDARALLVDRLGGTASKIEAPTLYELADLCDGFPWLIRLLAAQLTGRPRAAARFVADLRASGSALVSTDQSGKVARFLDLAYEQLPRGEQAAYRALALVPGAGFTAATAAAALGLPRADAEEVLDTLVDNNLVTYEEALDRYSFNRIIRADGRRRAREIDGPEGCRAVVARVTGWLLVETVPRDAGLSRRWRIGPVFEAAPDQAVDRDTATAWFLEEWRSLTEAVVLAHDHGVHAVAWQLCVAVFKYLHIHGHYDAWLDTHRVGVLSAQACGDLAGLMQVTSQRGAAHLALGEWDAAAADFESSWDAARQLGHALGEQSALEWRGKVEAARREFDAALEMYDRSLAVVARDRERIGALQAERATATTTLQRGRALLGKGEWQRAATEVRDTERWFAGVGERENQAKCLMVLGKAADALGDEESAAVRFGAAAELFLRDHAWRAQADASRCHAEVLVGLGRISEALTAFRAAHEILRRLGAPEADGIARRIEDISA